MDLFNKLEEVTNQQSLHGELPQWLADPVLAVARSPQKYQDKEYLEEILLEQDEK